jgi:hypothetical protein
MRSIRFEATSRCGAPSAIGDRIEDVALACAIVRGAVAKAEEAIASSGYPSRSWSPSDFVLAQQLRRVDAAAVAFERALAPPVKPAVAVATSTATLPDARVLETVSVVSKTIAAVEAARAAMPDQRTIATVEAANHAVSRQFKG